MKNWIVIMGCFACIFSVWAQSDSVVTGAEQTEVYFPLLQGKRIALFSNHTGMVKDKHLLDVLVENRFNVVAIFSPEHGFRGDAGAGDHVSSSVDPKTGVPILSLYDGDLGRPSNESMQKFDLLIVDIQDVGLRFYTYYVTMIKLMDACAEFQKKVILLDRPNPNGHYVDGPILDMKYKSGVGWLPIPVVHGLTLGELAMMVNGEKWLPENRTCDVTVQMQKLYASDPVSLTHSAIAKFAEYDGCLSLSLSLLFRRYACKFGTRHPSPVSDLRTSEYEGLQFYVYSTQYVIGNKSSSKGQTLLRGESQYAHR